MAEETRRALGSLSSLLSIQPRESPTGDTSHRSATIHPSILHSISISAPRVAPRFPLSRLSAFGLIAPRERSRGWLVGYPSGQRGQTVNLLAHAFPGSNPGPTTIFLLHGSFAQTTCNPLCPEAQASKSPLVGRVHQVILPQRLVQRVNVLRAEAQVQMPTPAFR